VALVPWLLAALCVVVVAGEPPAKGYGRDVVHAMFSTPFAVFPALVFGTCLGLLGLLRRRDSSPRGRTHGCWALMLASTATGTILLAAAILDHEWGFGLAWVWALTSGYPLLSFFVGGLLCHRYLPLPSRQLDASAPFTALRGSRVNAPTVAPPPVWSCP
jgi:hypothetical protein